jgi:hypothetical protein
MKKKTKPKGHWEECPACEGSILLKKPVRAKAEELWNMKDGQLRGHLVTNGKRFKVYLHIEEEK